jgi:hypothetical protein
MRDYLDIGSTPPGEECAQVGSDGYEERARSECQRFIDLLIRTIGVPPPGAALRIKAHTHDFGTYYSVACYFDPYDEESYNYAFKCESECPEYWDNES